jgi:hypothetical protein
LTGQGRWHTTSVQILDAQSAALLLLQGFRSKNHKKIMRSRGIGLASPLSLAGSIRGFLEAKLHYYKSVTF